MIKKILDEIKLIIEDKHDLNSLDFSYYLEEYLIEHYDRMYKENPIVTELLNEELPEICAMMEPGLDDTEFKKLLKKEYEKVMKQITNKHLLN
jgi:hypothetical protein